MAEFEKFTPASKWRAFFILAAGTVAIGAGPPTPPPDYAQMGKPTVAEAQKMLEQFQQATSAGPHYLEFELRVMPRRGEEKLLPGRLWSGSNEQGAITRISLFDGAKKERRFLLQNGRRAAAWRYADGQIEQLGVSAWFEPLVTGVDIAPFDLQMPFLYWPEFTVENVVRMLGRPAQVFFFRPPALFSQQHPEVTGVRLYLDTQFNAPVQTELIGPAGRVLKTLSLNELKRIGNQPMVKSIDMRNETTRDKTRFQVTGVALGMDFTSAIFEPGALAEDMRPPAPDRITRLAP